MIQMMLLTLMFLCNFIFLNMSHPLAMGLTLLIQTTLICLMTGMMTKSFWFSYILFLVFIGGMLVLFIYMTSLASNEMFSFSTMLLTISMMILIMTMIYLYILDKNLLIQYNNNEMNMLIKFNSFIMENSLSLNKLYNYPSNLLTIMLMNYLLITMIVVVKITKLFKGPLRSKLN